MTFVSPDADPKSLTDFYKWRNGSKVEVLPGTIIQCSGPHPPVVHADEVEMMSDDAWRASHEVQ